jgi:hypothetical protein
MYYIQLDVFSITKYITNPFSLIAFIIAAIMTYLSTRNINTRKKIELVNKAERAEVIIKTAEKLHLDINVVPEAERADLIIRVLNNRIKTQIISALALVVVIIAFLIYFLIDGSKNSDPNKTLPDIKNDSIPSSNRDSPNSQNVSRKDINRNKREPNSTEADNIEISIQLSKSYKNVLLNEKDAQILASSTPLNPRILVKSNPTQMQIIKIINSEGDTCILQRIFYNKSSKNFPIRFIPECNIHN